MGKPHIENHGIFAIDLPARWHNWQAPVLAPKGATPVTVQKLLVTRNEVREMGLRYSNTHFGRLEKAKELHLSRWAGFPPQEFIIGGGSASLTRHKTSYAKLTQGCFRRARGR